MAAGREHDRRIVGYRSQQIETCGMRGLVGRQGQAFAMRQDLDVDRNGISQLEGPAALMISPTSAVATSFFVITGQDATWIVSFSRVKRCTVLRSPPITPVDGET